MHLKMAVTSAVLLLSTSLVTVAQEPAMTVERAEQLLAVLGQAQQCIGLGKYAGKWEQQERIDEVFINAGRELVTAVQRGHYSIYERFEDVPWCIIVMTKGLPHPKTETDLDEAYAVGFRVGRGYEYCEQTVVKQLNKAVPRPASKEQAAQDRWSEDRKTQAQIWMTDRGCSLVRLPN